MRKLYVPISTDPALHSEVFFDDFQKLGVSHIFLAEGARLPVEGEERRAQLYKNLKGRIAQYSNKGYEVGVWISTLGYGGPLEGNSDVDAQSFTKIRSVVGREMGDANCPLDERFTARVVRAIEDICRAGARMIMLDDELCLSVRPGLGCACNLHLAEFSRRLGEEVAFEALPELLFAGKSNRYRRVWLDLMGDTLRDFCRTLRSAVDRIDPTIRMGFCAGYTSWDTEGVNAIELTHILAGNTKPFLRLSSAPYWYASQRFACTTLPTFIEFARIQAEWCRGEGIEIFTECDTYPHDRYHVPRTYIECFDAATLLSPDLGVLKYFYHYPCQPEVERGYIDAHIKAMPVYEQMMRAFHSKNEVGVRVYEKMEKLRDATLPAAFDRVKSQKWIMRKYAFSEAQAMLSSSAIPTVYEGEGLAGIVFGENAYALPKEALAKGLMLDLDAAEILQEQGVDVGLREASPLTFAALEEFSGNGYPVSIAEATALCELTLDPAARVISEFVSTDYFSVPRRRAPACYLYENKEGQRFLVWAFRAAAQSERSGMYWNYLRGKQIAESLPWLGGRELPAVCTGHPHLYCRCNESEQGVAVAYFNCTADGIDKTVVHFGRAIDNVKIIGGVGRQLNAHDVELSNIPAYGYVAIEAAYI